MIKDPKIISYFRIKKQSTWNLQAKLCKKPNASKVISRWKNS